MAVSFNKQKGSAQKNKLDTYEYKLGSNTVRLVGDILARYVYWVEGENNKQIPFECLSFDRDEEAFTNMEKDWVKEMYPDLKCGWAYATQVLDNGSVKVINLKKKLWEQVMDAAESLGDPTDVETGWDLVFEKVKTGPHAFNVEYRLQPLKCKQRALTDDELEAIKDLKSMDVVMPRPTPDAQNELLTRIQKAKQPENVDEDSIENEFNNEGSITQV